MRHLLTFAALVTLAFMLACTATQPDVASSQREVLLGEDPDAQTLSHGVVGEAPDRGPWLHDAGMDQAAQWLIDNQNEDGSWGTPLQARPRDIFLGGLNSLQAFWNASVALDVIGLMEYHDAHEGKPPVSVLAAAERGFQWLITAAEAKRVQLNTFYNLWAHLYMIEAFSRAINNQWFPKLNAGMRARGRLEMRLLLGIQNAEGGFGYYDFRGRTLHPSGFHSTSFGTAAVLVALKEAGKAGFEVPSSVLDLAQEALERLHRPDGAYLYSFSHIWNQTSPANRIEGSLTRSQAGNLALFQRGSALVGQREVRRGLDNFFTHHDYPEIARQRQNPHETWFANAPYYYYFGHYYAAHALDVLADHERAAYALRLADFVGKTQESDGSFWDYPLYGFTKAYGTGYGLAIQSRARRHVAGVEEEALKVQIRSMDWNALRDGPYGELNGPILRAANWLLENQLADGRWGHSLPTRPADIYQGGLNSLQAWGNATSGLASMAILKLQPSERIDAALLKGYTWLVSAPETRRVNDHTFYNVWSHTYMLQALALGLDDKRLASLHPAMRARIGQELKGLLSLQALDGGFGYFDFAHRMAPPSGRDSNAFLNGAVLTAFDLLTERGIAVPKAAINRCIDSLQVQRLPNGAYLYSLGHINRPQGRANQVEGSLGRSQAGNYGLAKVAKTIGRAEVKQGLDNLFAHHDYIEIARQREFPHETWFANAPYYYYFGHFYAAACVGLLEPADQPAYARRLADFLVATQERDGSFWDYPLYGFTKAYGTGYALWSLLECAGYQQEVVPTTAAKTQQ